MSVPFLSESQVMTWVWSVITLWFTGPLSGYPWPGQMCCPLFQQQSWALLVSPRKKSSWETILCQDMHMLNLGSNHTAFLPADSVIPTTGSVLHFLNSLKLRTHLSNVCASVPPGKELLLPTQAPSSSTLPLMRHDGLWDISGRCDFVWGVFQPVSHPQE